MKPPLRLLGTLLISGAFLAPQMLLPTQPALADKAGVCATPGKDGVGSGINGAVNTYYPGTSASGTSITVGTARGSTAIQAGDLLLVIQMQGADIDSTNTSTYGDGNGGNNGAAPGDINGNLNTNFTAGNFEYVVATSGVGTGGGTFSISTSLVNTYSDANFGAQGQRRFQIIRIPQYTSATLGGAVTALPWNGFTGGIVAMDVAGTLNMGGQTINVTGQGFRGGGGRRLGGGAGSNTDVRTLASVNTNGAKGEGTAGTPQYLYDSTTNALVNTGAEGYPGGSNGRGAPGTAGGGGTDGRSSANDQNAGGGGGSNGGVGGRGGNTWSSNLPYGGVGGAAFSAAAANRLVLGGGGGAGSNNDGTGTPGAGLASSGAAGGGAVLIRTGTIGTAGTITADGAAVTLVPANDASGGGGAGGSVLVISQNNSAAGLTINARGGQGGTNTGGGAPHGPGAGGGGGAIFSSAGASVVLTGGSAGTTAGGGFGGATGGTGLSAPVSVTPTNATTSIAGATCVPQLTVTKTTSTPTITAGGTATYTMTVANAANKASATQVDVSDALPTGFTYASVGAVNLSGGATRTTITNPSVGATNPSFGQFTIPGGGQVQITFTVNVGAGTAPATYQNPATATYLDPNRTTANGTTTATYNPASSTGEDVTVSSPVVTVSGTVFSDADADVTINGSDAGTNAGSPSLTIYAVDGTGKVVDKATVSASGTYSLTNVPKNTSVTLQLSNDATVAVGATAPTTSTIPSGWYYTGENKNGTVDGTIATLGNIALTTTTSNLTNENFGIRQAYAIAADAAPNTCNPDYRTALNTGVSAGGGQLVTGTNDLNWTAEWIAGPASGPGTPYASPRPVGAMPAVVVGNLASGAWVNEPANARWISYPFRLSVNGNGNHNNADLDGNNGEDGSGNPIIGTSSDAVRLKFTSTLTLPSNATTTSISLPIGAAMDNQFISIKVNGVENLSPVPAPNSQANGYAALQMVNITSGWQTGVNTIEVVMDSGPPLAGFLLAVQATTTQVCSTPVTVSGTVFSDADGSITINGSDAGTNAGSANLTLYAADSAGKVVDKATVAANGTYSLANVPQNASVTLRLSNDSTVAVGATAPTTATLPNNWVNTGENKNGTTETITPGDIALTTTTTNVTNQNFGIEQLPNTTDLTPASQNNPGGTTTVQVPTLAGTDPEDGALGSGKSFKIVTLPTNGTLYYNGTAVTAGQVITAYDPMKLTLDPTPTGAATVSFTYAAVDAAGKEDPTPATVTMPFSFLADLKLTKTVDVPNPPVGSTIKYTVTVTNSGPSSATNVAVQDLLPAGVTFTAATPSQGTYNNSTGLWTVGTIANGSSATLQITVIVNAGGTITNTAEVSASDQPDPNSTPGNHNPAEDDQASVSTPFSSPRLQLVKRITAINGAPLTTVLDDSSSTADNAPNWPTPLDGTSGISSYLKGVINGGTIKAGDILEYTIYFLSDGGTAATNISLCDLVPTNSTFVPNSFSSTPESGINLTIGSTSTNLTNVPDTDGGQFFNPGGTPSVTCSATNTNGAVVVNVVKSPANLPSATAPGTPSGSYGFIRFRAQIN